MWILLKFPLTFFLKSLEYTILTVRPELQCVKGRFPSKARFVEWQRGVMLPEVFYKGGIGMRVFLKSSRTGVKLVAVIASVMTILILAAPVLAADLTPEQKLASAAQLSAQAAELAATAQETGNVALLQEAMAKAAEAANLIAEVAAYAASAGNTALAQSAMNQAANLTVAIAQVTATAQYFVQTGTDPAVVTAANGILVQSGQVLSQNQGTMELALNAGATPPPGEAFSPPAPPSLDPPVADDPPIQDTGAASPV